MEKIKIGKLVMIRHHESEWNKLGKWTGIVDVHLTPNGFERSKEMGGLIADYKFDHIFTSSQIRSQETLSSMLTSMPLNTNVPIDHVKEINERDYGDYTGKNKWEMQKILGEEQFTNIRRGWDTPIPNGESLKMVYERSVPFYVEKILPLLKKGGNILVVAHGNSIRSIMKYIENISDEGVEKVEMIFGSILIYGLNEDGHMINKEVRQLNSN